MYYRGRRNVLWAAANDDEWIKKITVSDVILQTLYLFNKTENVIGRNSVYSSFMEEFCVTKKKNLCDSF